MWALVGAALLASAPAAFGLVDDTVAVATTWLSVLAQWAAVAVCWRAVRRVGNRKWMEGLVAAAVTAFAVGCTGLLLFPGGGDAPAASLLAGLVRLLFGPLLLTALVVLVYRQLRRPSWLATLDSAVGALGGNAVLWVIVAPIVYPQVGAPNAGVMVAVAQAVMGAILVAVVTGTAATRGLTVGRHWMLLAVGLCVLTPTDLLFAFAVAGAGPPADTPGDAGWAVGVALVAAWLSSTTRAAATATRPTRGVWPMVVPSATTACAIGVLVLGSTMTIPAVAVWHAALAVVGALLRAVLAFGELRRMVVVRTQTRTDDLTGLPNRRALHEDVPARLAEGGRWALLLLDLDRFKEVNDSLGHDVGDRLLVQIGERLAARLQPGDLLVRLGGDEFAVVCEDAAAPEAVALAGSLRDALAVPFTLEGIALTTTASIGISLYPEHGTDLSGLLRKADMAMYKAKTGGTGHHVFRGSDDSHAETRLRTLDELRTGLATDELVLHFQPKLDLASGEVRGVEALVRWNHPTRGLLYPDAFLDLVEESGLMHDLTRVVLDKALAQAARWQAAGTPLTVAVNFSVSSLIDAALPGRIAERVVAHGLPTSALLVEVTEDFLMADRDRAHDILSRLRALGIRIAMDDFGTGYSSLAYLRDLPIDELKLDRAFVAPMEEDPRAAALVAATIVLAHSLGLVIVAEGIEDEAAYEALAGYGCDQGQGYFMSRPVPAGKLDEWLAAHQARELAR